MKKIENYLHLYLGCEVLVTDIDGQTFKDRVESVINDNEGKKFSIYEFGDCPFNDHEEYYQKVQPILRPLSDMTEEEARGYADCYMNYITDDVPVKVVVRETGSVKISIGNEDHGASLFPAGPHGDKPEAFRFLLSKGFDLFGLIEAGLAIDKTKNN